MRRVLFLIFGMMRFFASCRALSSPRALTTPTILTTSHGKVALVREPGPLYPEEEAVAEQMTESARRAFALGRTAMHQLIDAPIGRAGDGRPLLPRGYRGSISHKGRVGVALLTASDNDEFYVGVDLEQGVARHPERLAKRILNEDEMESLGQIRDYKSPIPIERDVLMRFSCKESIYKAVYPFVGRYFGFREAGVYLQGDGTARARLYLPELTNVEVSCTWQWIWNDEFLITTSCARRIPR